MSASTDLWETWRSNPQVHPIETTSDSTVEFDKKTVRFDWGKSPPAAPMLKNTTKLVLLLRYFKGRGLQEIFPDPNRTCLST